MPTPLDDLSWETLEEMFYFLDPFHIEMITRGDFLLADVPQWVASCLDEAADVIEGSNEMDAMEWASRNSGMARATQSVRAEPFLAPADDHVAPTAFPAFPSEWLAGTNFRSGYTDPLWVTSTWGHARIPSLGDLSVPLYVPGTPSRGRPDVPPEPASYRPYTLVQSFKWLLFKHGIYGASPKNRPLRTLAKDELLITGPNLEGQSPEERAFRIADELTRPSNSERFTFRMERKSGSAGPNIPRALAAAVAEQMGVSGSSARRYLIKSGFEMPADLLFKIDRAWR